MRTHFEDMELNTHPYVDLPADDRLEARLPRRLKADAEALARARGQTLTQWLLAAMAEKISADHAQGLQWQLTPAETETMLQALAAPYVAPSGLLAARAKAEALLGPNPQ
ncbi:MAG: hypothetical protein HY902_07770 [Deltaproteobacteria bacterium]|nr:hypothetical protein [Deltaproteobacteria bacterium]